MASSKKEPPKKKWTASGELSSWLFDIASPIPDFKKSPKKDDKKKKPEKKKSSSWW